MTEDKHTWDRVPAWDGDKRQWKRCLRDAKLYLETEKLDVDFSHGDRMPSRLTGSARKYADQKVNERFRNRFRKPRDGKTGRCIAYETDAHDAEEDPSSESV